MIGILIRISCEETDIHTGECHVKTEVLLPQAKEMPEAKRESWKRILH